ncbi:MAG TPA: hypothetical protein VMY06_14890 [Sedimentisphaerales bacterium]|nr:hypothetical protein [Sedimentisphaerales bacterium]HUU15573.1 hypothetical protein [Sedimentisphaerales bacterium]
MATLRAAIDARGATRGAAEFDRATGKMKRSAGTATKSIESGFASAMRRILMFGGAGGAIYTLKKFIDSASDAQETMNKFNVVFKDNSKEAAAWSEQFGDSVGRATQDVQKWMAGLQDLFVPLGFARKEAMGLSMDLTTLAVDVASFSNKADDEVIRDFTSALVGNHETVRKYGIIISETALAQEAFSRGLKKEYKDLTDLEKVQLRMSLIQKGTLDAQGDAIRSMNDYANQVKRLNANFTELRTELGGPLMVALSDVLTEVNKHSPAWKEFFRIQSEGWAEIFSGFDSIGIVAKEMGGRLQRAMGVTNTQLELARRQGNALTHPSMMTQAEKDDDVARHTYMTASQKQGQLPAESEEAALNRRLQEVYAGPAVSQTSPLQKTEEDIKKRQEFERRVIEDTQQGIESVRNMDYLTRMERIKNLEAYRDAHTNVLSQVFKAEIILNEEILSLKRSRLDAMKVYNAELQEDFEDSSLYISERFADAAHSIESSMGNSFFSMISQGASWKDAMTGFFVNVGEAFGRMASEMMARAIMMKTMGIIMGGGPPGYPVGVGSAKAPTYVPHAMGNVFNMGRVVPMANGDIFDRPTYFPMADGKTGLIGEGGLEAAMPVRRMRGGRLGVEASGGQPNITVSPTPVKIVFVKNDREAQIELLKGKEGEKAFIQHAIRNRNLL